jgi:molybdate transport system substrate-binding protein
MNAERGTRNERQSAFCSAFSVHPSSFFLHPFALLLIVSSIFLLSCSSRKPVGGEEPPPEINVAAAANLSDAFVEMGKRFTEQTGIRVVYSFGATADLARQIENGAPFDLFAAADTENVERLNRAGLLTGGTVSPYARGRLVLWTPQASRVKVERLEDLTNQDVERIAVAKPDLAPYGRATVEALRALNLWASVEPKIIYGQNVSQVKQYAATGNADVAFIPLSLARGGEGRAIEIAEHLHQPIIQSLAVIKSSTKQEQARRFASFVLSSEGQSLLARYGYDKAGDR